MNKLYVTLKYGFICIWSMFVVAPFLWALSTSFKDFQSVTSGATYIPWLQFEPTLEGWRVLWRTPAKGGVDIVEPYLNSIIVTCSASLISILLGTLAAYALSRFTFKAGFIKNNDMVQGYSFFTTFMVLNIFSYILDKLVRTLSLIHI